MKDLVLDFLKSKGEIFEGKNSEDILDKVQFSAVPKGGNGDLAMSFFQLTKTLGKSPIEIGNQFAEMLAGAAFLEKAEMAGPYLNLFFEKSAFFEQVFAAKSCGDFLEDKKFVIEFSGPNTNKPLHLGHMRNHALGVSVSALLERAGARVHRVNIINDRGVHICKSMLAYDRFGKGKSPASENKKSDHFVGDFYVKFEQASKEDEKLKDEVQKMLVNWESGDDNVRNLWKKMNDWTLSGHKITYKRQGINFEKDYLESDFYAKGADLARMGVEKGVFKTREDGAIVFDFEDREKVVLRADGTSIYLTNDLAVDTARIAEFHPDTLIHVVADEQNEHFKILFAALGALGEIDAQKCLHLSYGLVNLPDGRMKSREGTVVDADNLMDELHAIAARKIRERHVDFSDEQAYKIAEQIQNAAWKFYLLRTGARKTITFDKEQSIDFQGATGPYLQYAGVRIRGLLRKANITPSSGKTPLPLSPIDTQDLNQRGEPAQSDTFPDNNSPNPSYNKRGSFTEFLGEEEKALGVKILEFSSVLERSAVDKNPTFMATYLLELAQVWSSYYASVNILQSEERLKQARLALAEKVLEILESGLEGLGIEVPEVM